MSWVALHDEVTDTFAALVFDPWLLFEVMATRKPPPPSLAFDLWAEKKQLTRTRHDLRQCCGIVAGGGRCKRHRNEGSAFCGLHAHSATGSPAPS